jgi:hypothetical protein
MVPRHMGVNANETAYELARQGFSHPLRGTNAMLGTPVKSVRQIRDWRSRQHKEHWQSIHGQRQAKGFLKNPPKQAGELLNLTTNQRRILTWLLTGHCHLRGRVFKL